ncbi:MULTISPECIES: TonB-dependent receptor [unclassified Carboxylicivirga]|uniref:TonB-dependent receptor n=1 Tax=Carboxylicivirga TaxID=1628153 RepID=UPI003D3329A8
MRGTLFLMMLGVMQMYAAGSYSQNTRVSLDLKNVSLKQMFSQIEEKSEFYFIYDATVVDVDQKVSVIASNKLVSEILDNVFGDSDVKYKIENRQIAITSQTNYSSQQSIAITGVVTDNTGTPLPGVTVVIKGTSNGIITDYDGKYSLSEVPADATLVFSFIGMKTQEVTVGGNKVINVTLVSNVIGLDEVVAVGYGTQKKVNLTGAIASVSSNDLNRRVITSTESMLQGRLPGLQVIQNSGEPGNNANALQVRGLGTFDGAGKNPLVLIDGIPGSMSSVNPNNIESVTLLKDAASSSIYGSRAANGVILITTKQGEKGQLSVEYGANLGIYSPTVLPDLVTNSADYMELYNEAMEHTGGRPVPYTAEEISMYRNATDRNKYPNTDWLDLMIEPAFVQNHFLRMSGGTEKTVYNVSFGLNDEPGVMEPFYYKKYNAQFNITSSLDERITFGANIGMNYDITDKTPDGGAAQYAAILSQGPTYKPKLENGDYVKNAFLDEYENKFQPNPYAIIETTSSQTKGFSVQSSAFVDVKLADWLRWKVKGGVNINNSKNKIWHSNGVNTYHYNTGEFAELFSNGKAGLSVKQFNDIQPVLYSHLTFDKQLSDHNIKALVGYQQENYKYETLGGFREGFFNSSAQELDAGSSNGQTVEGTSQEWAILSYFGRLNYNYKEKYLLELNGRYDGSSRFSEDNRWGFFPSMSVGWRMSEESFLQDVDYLSNLKLRASFGVLGNQDIGYYPYQDILSIIQGYPFDGALVSGARPSSIVDKDMKWETTRIYDVGFDVSLFDSRFNFTFDWFNKFTYDILRRKQVGGFYGLQGPVINGGEMRNTGFEFDTRYTDQIDDFRYSLSFNLQTYKNTVEKFGEREISGNTIIEEGKPWRTWYMYEWVGVFQSQADIDNSAVHPNQPKPGDIKFRDVDNNGVIDQNDRVHIDGAFPKFSYSFSMSASWKNFDFSAQFAGVEGRKLYMNYQGMDPFYKGTPPSKKWLTERWTPDNPTNKMPAIYAGFYHQAIEGSYSSYYLHDADFLRLKNLQIGFTLPQRLVSKLKLQNVRFYYSGDNVLTFDSLDGVDPERVANSGTYAAYPQNKVHSLGLNVKF